jgi:hypothetical protein
VAHIRCGDWVIHADHLIAAKRNSPRKGGLRLKLQAGWTVDLAGKDAEAMWDAICRLVPESTGCDPETTGGHGARRPTPGK